MRVVPKSSGISWPLAIAILLPLSWVVTVAQTPTVVQFTEAIEREVRRSVRISGVVASGTDSVVASEVSGLVIGMDVREGDAVVAGQPLVRLRLRWHELQLREARGRLQEAQARQELAQSKLARARELFADLVISEQDLDDAVSEFTAWEGREEQSRAEVARLEFSLERLTIRAPFDGVVIRKRTDLGEWIEQGGAVVDLVSLGTLQVRLEVPERYFSELRVGALARIGFENIPGFDLEGRVTAIIPRADPQARTFPLKVALPPNAAGVGIGMLAQVDLPIGERYRALTVPKDAVVRDGPTTKVFRIVGDDAVEVVDVSERQGVGSWVVVEGPLAAGDRVVTRGNERLRPGQTVQPGRLEYAEP